MLQSYKNLLNNQLLPWLVVLCAFSIPLKTGVFSVFVGLLVITWLISFDYKKKYEKIIANKFAVAACLLFLIFTIGLFYGELSWHDYIPGYLKYHKLLYIPIVVSIIRNKKYSRYAINAFLMGCFAILIISYLKLFSIIPSHDLSQGYIVSKNRITHNILMGYAAFYCMHIAYSKHGLNQFLWGLFAYAMIFNIFIMVNGLTGQLVFLCLIILFIFQVKSMKILKLLFLGGITIIFLAYSFGLNSNNRLLSQLSGVNDPNTSSGQRLHFYKNTLEIIKQHPMLGNGTGSFRFEYSKLFSNKYGNDLVTNNPHNQYLLIASEIGLIGLFYFLYLFFVAISSSFELEAALDRYALQGLTFVMIFGSLFNSLLMDAGEGRFWTFMSALFLSELSNSKRRN